MEELVRAIGALVLVLSLILGCGWAARRFLNTAAAHGSSASDLRVVEWRGIDSRRKLAVIQWDDKQHLLCFGPGGDTLVASREAPIIAPPEAPASPPEDAPRTQSDTDTASSTIAHLPKQLANRATQLLSSLSKGKQK